MVLYVQRSLGRVIGIVFFRHNSGDMKCTCWTTGSWWWCLSLEVMSSILAGSRIIYWFLCGFMFVSLYQSITIKPTNKYILSHNIFQICFFITILQYILQLFNIAIKKIVFEIIWEQCTPYKSALYVQSFLEVPKHKTATSHHLNQCWPRSILPYDITRPHVYILWDII